MNSKLETEVHIISAEIISHLNNNLETYPTYKEHGYVEETNGSIKVSGDGIGGVLL